MQPEDKKPRSVKSSLLSTATARASPVGVTPATAGAAPSSASAPGPGAGAGDVKVTGAEAGAVEGSPTPAPRSCRARRMSAWLRNRPATRMPSTRTTNVETMTNATMPPPFPRAPVSIREQREARHSGAGIPRAYSVLCWPTISSCRSPSRGRCATPSFRWTTMSWSPPTRSSTGCRGALADRAPRIVETPEGHQVWEFEGQRYTQVGMNAVAGRRPETYGLEPFRFDQMRPGLLRRRRPRARHGHQRRLGVGELPLHDHRVLRPRLLRRQGPRPGPGLCQSVERLALRRVVLGAPRAHRPPRDHLPGRPGAGRGRDPPQRRTRLHLGDVPRATARNRACPPSGTGRTGTRSWRPSSRPTPWSPCTWAARG